MTTWEKLGLCWFIIGAVNAVTTPTSSYIWMYLGFELVGMFIFLMGGKR